MIEDREGETRAGAEREEREEREERTGGARAPVAWLPRPAGLLLALEFLIVLPLYRLRTPPASGDAPDMANALPWFPLVGALLGAALALLDWASASWLALGVRDALLLAALALVTGMLHLDGFVDCCDALLGAHSVERRLEILKDSRVGAYGALGAGLLLVTQYAALGALPGGLRALALVVAPLLGRWSMVYAVTRFPYARSRGLGAFFRASWGRLLTATLGLLALLLGAALALTRGLPLGARLALGGGLLLVALLVTLGWTRFASRRLGGGLTGDTYGALNELVTLAALLALPPLAQALHALG